MRVWILGFCLLGGAVVVSAAPGVVRTVAGQSQQGEVRLVAGGVSVQPIGRPALTVAAAQLAQLTLGETHVLQPSSGLPNLPKGQGKGLLGAYYTTSNLTGSAVMRLDETVHFNWHTDEPLPAFKTEFFSVRWMGDLEAPTTDTYTFTVGSDDGSRLRVGDQFVLDQWRAQEYAETNGSLRLEAGRKYPLTLEYFNGLDNARVSLFWSSSSYPKSVIPKDRLYPASHVPEHQADLTGDTGLLGTYYAGQELNGFSYNRIDPDVNFQWLGVAPAPGLPASRYSVRWSGQVRVETGGAWTFSTVTDEGCRLWINDRLLVNTWLQPFMIEQNVEVILTPGQVCDLRFETRDYNGQLIAKLFWTGPGVAKTLIPSRAFSPVKPVTFANAPGTASTDLPVGVTLLGGAVIAAPILSASDAAARLQGLLKDTPLPLTRLARLQLRASPRELLAKLPADRAGVLLKDGDFADGDFAGIEDGRVKLNSVLFGERTLEPSAGAAVIALRPVRETPWHWHLKTRDGTQFYLQEVRMENGRLVLPEVSDFTVVLAEVEQLTRR